MTLGEFLSEDILDENFIRCFSPIHGPQSFLGSSRVDIRDYFVTPTTIGQKLYSCMWIVLTLLSVCNIEIFYYEAYYNKNNALYFACSLGALLMYISYTLNIIQVRFFKGEQSVRIYLMLQKIDRSLKLKHFKSLNDTQYFFSIIIVSVLVMCYGCSYLVHMFYCVNNPGIMLFLGLGLTTLFLELLLTGSLIYYLTGRLRFLTDIGKYNILMKKENNIPGVDHSWTLKEHYRIISNEEDPSEKSEEAMGLKSFVLCLKCILRAFKIISNIFQFQVLNLTSCLFFWTFLVIEGMVIGLQTGLMPLIGVVTIGLWILFFFVALVGLVIVFEGFVKQVNQLKSLCTYALSIYFEGPIFIVSKAMITQLEFDVPVFSIYGIFHLDRALPLKLVRLITNYVVVLLQFTL